MSLALTFVGAFLLVTRSRKARNLLPYVLEAGLPPVGLYLPIVTPGRDQYKRPEMTNYFAQRFLSIAFLFLISYWHTGAQNEVVVAEGYLQSMSTEGQLTVRITKVHNGAMAPGIVVGQHPKVQMGSSLSRLTAISNSKMATNTGNE